MNDRQIRNTWKALRIGMGLGPFLAGADKFTNLLCRWEKYIAPPFARLLPMKKRTFMRTVGVVEMGVGLSILAGATRSGGYTAGAWLSMIAANLVVNGDYDLAVRDLHIALGAVALAKLTEAGAGGEPRERLPGAVRRPYDRLTHDREVPPTADLAH